MKEKTFHRAILEFKNHPGKIKKYLKDNRLTQVEKNILTGHFLRKKNKNVEIIDLLKTAPETGSSFIDSQKHFILGLAYNNLTEFKLAEEHLVISNSLLEGSPYHQFLFTTNYILFWIYANIHNLELMTKALRAMENSGASDEHQKIQLLRSYLCYYQMTEKVEKAKSIILQLDKLQKKLVGAEFISYLVDKFMFYVQIEDFSNCESLLAQMKKVRDFNLSENYNYLKTMLNNYLYNTSIYAYEDDYRGAPVLFFQLKFIQALEERNMDSAISYWKKLEELFPDIYREEFEYKGTKTIFSCSLSKYRDRTIESSEIKFEKQPTKISGLEFLFTHNPEVFFSPEEIFYYIWEKEVLTQEDLNKVTRLVSRLKSESECSISFHKGKYKLD